jgi:carboxymethylenebutenolidase
MGQFCRLTADDGHQLGAYEARPAGRPIGGIVIVQEIFGLTGNIREVTDRYAEHGLHAVAPAYFDRVAPDLVIDYDDIDRGRATMQQLEWSTTLADTSAALAHLAGAGKLAVLGFCWGGTVAHVAAAELPLAAAVSYYGPGVARLLDKRPRCPIIYHFGALDGSIPPDAVEAVRDALPDAPVFVYPGAGHGFSSSERASYLEAAAALAFERSLGWLRKQLVQA